MTDIEISEVLASGNGEDIAAFLCSKKDDPEFPGIARRVIEQVYGLALSHAFVVAKDLQNVD